MRIVPIALVIALSPSLALAQSWTATTGTTKPTTTAPASNTKIGRSAEEQDPARGTVPQQHRFARWRGRGRRQSH